MKNKTESEKGVSTTTDPYQAIKSGVIKWKNGEDISKKADTGEETLEVTPEVIMKVTGA